MSTATITRPVRPASSRETVRRPVRRPTELRGPLARPARGVPAPSHRSLRGLGVRACRLEPGAAATTWRLTDRGIAVVLVLAAMIMTAAVAVIGLTAWQVTGPGYQAGSTAPVSSR